MKLWRPSVPVQLELARPLACPVLRWSVPAQRPRSPGRDGVLGNAGFPHRVTVEISSSLGNTLLGGAWCGLRCQVGAGEMSVRAA